MKKNQDIPRWEWGGEKISVNAIMISDIDIACMHKCLDNAQKYNRVLAEQGHLDDEGYSR